MLSSQQLSLYPPSHEQHVSQDRPVAKVRAERIVTTLPSATEIVSLLGLEDKLVGITHECDYPLSVKKKPVVMRSVFDTTLMTSREIDDNVISRVTSGRSVYEIDEKLLQHLSPDLIITQEALRSVCDATTRSSKNDRQLDPKPEILSLSPHDLEEVIEDVIRVGRATGTLEKAEKISKELLQRVAFVRERIANNSGIKRPTVFCLEWLNPIYCSGHWMPELVEYSGGNEVLGKFGEPSTVVEWEQVREADPEVIFVTVCGYDVQRTLKEISNLTNREGWKNMQAVRNEKVYVLDSPAYYSRSGPRLVDGLEIMAFLLHPELFPRYKTPRSSAYSLAARKFI